MTREDAVTTLKDISEMVHKQKEIEKSTLYGILDSNNEPIEALDMAIKALEQEPCEDCISREEVCDYIAEFVNHEYATDRERELVKNIIGGIQHLPSIQPTAKENLVVEDCISRKQAMKACYQMAVRTGIEEMPYKYAETELAHLPSIQPRTGHCKECKYFKYDSVAKVDGIPLIVAHEICKKWGDGCKTSEDGYCFLFEPQESEDKE